MPKPNSTQHSLDFDGPKWPPQHLLPINWPPRQQRVEPWFLRDLKASKEYDIITGFTSLSELVTLFGGNKHELPFFREVRVMLGFEQEPRPRDKMGWPVHQPLADEIRDYWLRRGISIVYGGAILRTIALLEEPQGWLQMRLLDGLHAKLYVGDTHAMLGSSNFSPYGLGLNRQIEANVRYKRQSPSRAIANRYEHVKQLGQNFWAAGVDYNKRAVELLKSLLQVVTWPEALARAIAEILEGDSLFEAGGLLAGAPRLWPHQRQGVAQALYVLDHLGNVLVADPTGSGKTKLVGTLLVALERRKQARLPRPLNLAVVAPPAILRDWKDWCLELGRGGVVGISGGQLSKKEGTPDPYGIRKELQAADVLVLDEAHRYLNARSLRTQQLLQHSYQHLLLTTATPLNRHATDLLRLIELLDVDNLSDADLHTLERLRVKPLRKFAEADVEQLRQFIGQFLLRRTRHELASQIKRQPKEYERSAPLRGCNYPDHKPQAYPTKETARDKEIAGQMQTVAEKLVGIRYLLDLNPKKAQHLETEEDKRRYLEKRVELAPYLARFTLRQALRSSNAALHEHLAGAQAAADKFGLTELPASRLKTQGVIQQLEEVLAKGEMPKRNPDELPAALVPQSWLYEPDAWRAQCAAEVATYHELLALLGQLTEARERGKVQLIAELLGKHGHALVLAFDHSLITLERLRLLFEEQKLSGRDSFTVTGAQQKARKRLENDFKLGSTASGVVAFCSDVVSESLNLQQTSALVQLDMPTVLRVAEQRLGRLDRLDSPHENIASYWPKDSPAFSLKADEHLIQALRQAGQLIGNNLVLPDEHLVEFVSDLEKNSLQKSLNPFRHAGRDEARWAGLHDALQPVRELIGTKQLVPPAVYEKIWPSRESIKCRVSYVAAEQAWAFFALRSSTSRSGNWYMLVDNESPETNLGRICQALRLRLAGHPAKSLAWEDGDAHLNRFLQKLQAAERQLLPHRARRALEVGEVIVQAQLKSLGKPKASGADPRIYLLRQVLVLFQPVKTLSGPEAGHDEMMVDFERLAAHWLQLLLPHVRRLRQVNLNRRHIVSLKTLKKHWAEIPLPVEVLQQLLDETGVLPTVDYRIASCIIGVATEISATT